MNAIKNWVITKLGGVTTGEFEQFQDQCEKWALDFVLNDRHKGVVVTAHPGLFGADVEGPVSLIRSRTIVENCRCGSGIYVAPWVRHPTLVGNIVSLASRSKKA